MYFSPGNGQPREPALCQLYRHTFVPYTKLLLTNTVMQHFDKFDNDIANNYTLCLSLLCILVQ